MGLGVLIAYRYTIDTQSIRRPGGGAQGGVGDREVQQVPHSVRRVYITCTIHPDTFFVHSGTGLRRIKDHARTLPRGAPPSKLIGPPV